MLNEHAIVGDRKIAYLNNEYKRGLQPKKHLHAFGPKMLTNNNGLIKVKTESKYLQ
ncbi:hypothetical protein J26TS2_08060 [Shouchella clausii]|nr:hypothetical protein J26TS2_08060 [Shouchella clausii]